MIQITPTNYYVRVQVNTYAEAVSLATGNTKKIIVVLTDETDSGNLNRYYYEGVEGVLDLQF